MRIAGSKCISASCPRIGLGSLLIRCPESGSASEALTTLLASSKSTLDSAEISEGKSSEP